MKKSKSMDTSVLERLTAIEINIGWLKKAIIGLYGLLASGGLAVVAKAFLG